MLERVLLDADATPALCSAWGSLTERAARTPFESPAWQLAWLRAYGQVGRPFLLTWWRAGDLVAIAPLVLRPCRVRGLEVRVLEPWGRTRSPISGWADLVADPDVREAVVEDLAGWLASGSVGWDLFDFLHLPSDSPLLAALATGRRRWRVDLTRSLHSLDYVIALPSDPREWRGVRGPKARHEIRRQERRFERLKSGRLEVLTTTPSADEVAGSLASLMTERWGAREAYFRVDPAYSGFIADAIGGLFEAGQGWAVVARDDDGVQGCLVMAAGTRTAVALMIGVTPRTEYRAMSLGSCLFHRAIDEAVARGCVAFSFLTEGAYKRTVWRAEGRPVASGIVGQGAKGLALAGLIWSRRVLPALARDAVAGQRSGRYLA